MAWYGRDKVCLSSAKPRSRQEGYARPRPSHTRDDPLLAGPMRTTYYDDAITDLKNAEQDGSNKPGR